MAHRYARRVKISQRAKFAREPVDLDPVRIPLDALRLERQAGLHGESHDSTPATIAARVRWSRALFHVPLISGRCRAQCVTVVVCESDGAHAASVSLRKARTSRAV